MHDLADAKLEAGLRRSLLAGLRACALITGEDGRALALGEAVGEALEWPVHSWSAAAGIDGSGRERELPALLAELVDPAGTRSEDALWLLFDAAASLRAPGDRRRLRELAQRSEGPALILVEASVAALGDLLALPELAVETLPLPRVELLAERARWAAAALADRRPRFAEHLRERAAAIARAGLGLELASFDRLLAEAALAGHDDERSPDAATYVMTHKAAALARDALLEPTQAVPLAELGGLDRYLDWLKLRARALEPEARRAGIPPPRGVLLVGVQGCGKSLAARASADLLGLPLIRLDLGRLFGGTVGESEANLRRATASVERMAPVVLWVDEIDKGLAGSQSGRSDAGTAARVVGGLLTWLQEREQAVFVIATANHVEGLPPELLRRGRLDELFFVDLPDAEQRAAILAIHLERKPARVFGHCPPLADPREAYLELARAAEGFSGAELEAALIEARLAAFARGEPLGADDLRLALEQTVPLSRSRAEAISDLRAWAETRARRA